jgi:3-hydroxybutyryl-CoA dehydrogenase
MSTIRTVAVVGAGQMGSGIAQAVAVGGYEVRLYDLAPERAPLAVGEIAASLARRAARGLTTEAEAQAALARIKPVASLAEAAQADLIIEAASEDEAVKKSVFVALTPLLGPDTLLASNTSSISITRLASATDRPDRFIGLHFMKPAPVMKLVELVHRHLRRHLRDRGRFRREPGQDHHRVRGLPRLHRQPHPGADDERGHLCAV